jgi:murein DD-endopeptidase MepM/ murein hydrolase activator NlpD
MNRRKKAFSLKNILGPIAIASAIASIPFIGDYVRNKKVEYDLQKYKASCVEKAVSGLDDTLNINSFRDLNANPDDIGKRISLDRLLGYNRNDEISEVLNSKKVYLTREIYPPFGNGYEVTSPFGERKFYVKRGRRVKKILDGFHNGTDFKPLPEIREGKPYTDINHPVYAGASGRIVDVGRKKREGIYVTIEASDKAKYTYCHLSRIEDNVRIGKEVEAGQKIGNMGRTGRCIRDRYGRGGYHVHLGGKTGEKYFDVAKYIAKNLKHFDGKNGRVIVYLQKRLH